MIQLTEFFKNHFDSEKISDGRIKSFSEDHINKGTAYLSVHTNPVIQALIDALLPLHNGYFGAITDEQVKFAIQQSRTITANNAWAALHGFIRQKEGTVSGLWGRESGTYQEFYPLGLEEYNQSNKTNREMMVARYAAAVTAHAAELGAQFVTDFTAVRTDWSTKLATQQQQIGLVKDADSQTNTSRDAVEVQLMKNVLGIAAEFVGQPDMAVVFFNRQLLLRPSEGSGGSENALTFSGTVTDNVTGEALADAELIVDGEVIATTNAAGQFSKTFTITEVLTIQLVIKKPGYKDYESSVQFSPGVDLTQDVQMAAKVGSISGTASDLGTALGIGGASITLTNGSTVINITADANGNYSKGGVRVGMYTATANAPGYIGQSVTVIINEDVNTVQNFSLVVVP